MSIARDFEHRWNFPNCLGAIDGKHVVIVKPGKTGSTFMNYKHTFSIVLMAVVDSNYRFRYVNVGAQGRISDAGVFSECNLTQALNKGKLNLPKPASLTGSEVVTPFVFIADEAFPLGQNLMKPFARRGLALNERIFNYRLSRARRVVENAFGILSGRFRVFKAPIALKTETVRAVVKATVCLHNFLIEQNATNIDDDLIDREDEQTGVVQSGNWHSTGQDGLQSVKSHSGRAPSDAKYIRQQLSQYFLNEGAVEWQMRFI